MMANTYEYRVDGLGVLKVVSISAKTEKQAEKKIKSIRVSGFPLRDWKLERVYEDEKKEYKNEF
jgi:hypothetical protein